MSKRVSMQKMRQQAPEWIFSWRRLGRPMWDRYLPLLVVSGFFGFAAMYVQVQVTPPQPWEARTGSIIHAGTQEEGRWLEMKAREGGPFPVRLDLREWRQVGELEQEALGNVGHDMNRYQPKMRELEDSSKVDSFVVTEMAVLPKRAMAVNQEVPVKEGKVEAVLQVFSKGFEKRIPEKLPEVSQAMVANRAGESRFLLRVSEEGVVIECISLSNEASSDWVTWLRGVSFLPRESGGDEWVSVELGFKHS